MRVAFIIAASLVAAPATPQAELPAPTEYFCSMERAIVAVNGEITFRDLYNKHKRPSAVTIPKTGDEGFVAESVSEDGEVYSYIKKSGDGMDSHMIHGVFNFNTKNLITSRSILFPTDAGAWVTESASFIHLCEDR